jgi:hypothetical protein
MLGVERVLGVIRRIMDIRTDGVAAMEFIVRIEARLVRTRLRQAGAETSVIAGHQR